MTRLVTTLELLGINRDREGLLLSFQTLFSKWNQSINLSAASTPAEVEEHVRDSLHVISYIQSASSVIDVGSGGGFPVVIAAICLPETSFTALEPVHKKHAFLRTAARELRLANLEARASRVEDHDRTDYDAAMSRATFDLREWLEIGARLVRPGGIVIGFEAVRRDDLPSPLERHPYQLDGKTRSILVAQRS